MNSPESCPKCNANWIGDPIPEGLMRSGNYKNMEQAEKAAANHYGWTPENGKCFKLEIGISDIITQDRTVAYKCPECKSQIKRK